MERTTLKNTLLLYFDNTVVAFFNISNTANLERLYENIYNQSINDPFTQNDDEYLRKKVEFVFKYHPDLRRICENVTEC